MHQDSQKKLGIERGGTGDKNKWKNKGEESKGRREMKNKLEGGEEK